MEKNTLDILINKVTSLGYPKEFGYLIARNLGSDRACNRMIQYLGSSEVKNEQTIVDEMLAIMDDCKRWRDKKESEEANIKYNEYLNSDLRI